jgi:hypothetical protein
LKDHVEVRSSEEIAAAIDSLTSADWVRLRAVSHKYAWLYPAGAEALLWEAIGRAVAGTRRCPNNVDVVRFLAEAMRSIADGEAKKIENKAPHDPLEEAGVSSASLSSYAERGQSPEAMMISTEEIAELRTSILNLFVDDPQARDLADGIMAGCEGEELRALTDLNKTAFASKRRLIRRRITKAYPKGHKQ